MSWNYGQEGPIGTITWKSNGPGPKFRYLDSDVELAGTSGITVTGSGSVNLNGSGILSMNRTVSAPTTTLGVINNLTLTFSNVTTYQTSNDETRLLNVDVETGTTGTYAGILNAIIGHVTINGGTISKVEAVAGVINIQPGATFTLADGYGTSGEWLHQSASDITGTVRGVVGTLTTLGAGSFATAYGGEFATLTTLGQAGRFTTLAQGVRGIVNADAAVAIAAATGASGEVFPTSTGSTTGITQGVLAWVHNTANYTYTGAVYGISALVNIAGAATVTGVAHAAQIVNQFGGTTAGGTTNVAMNAEINWGSSTVPGGAVLAGQFRARVSANAIVGTLEAIRVMAPVFASSGTATNHRGMHILNQGSASITTSTALLIDAQSGSGSNVAINILGGDIVFGTTFTAYNNITLGGNGVPSEVKYNRPGGSTVNATVTMATYTTPAADGSYEIQANLNVTVSTTVTMTVTCSYTDETNTARVLTLPFFLLAGTLVQSITTAQGNIAYSSMPITIRTKASTAITIATAGTVTAVTYTGEGIIKQLA